MVEIMLTLALISEAADFLESRVRRTPVEYSVRLSERWGAPVWLKLECLQVTGSFKVRGALFALSKLKETGIQEVATCSAGNHGLGLAYAANSLGIRATVYVPSGIDRSKYVGMLDLGAEVELSDYFGYDETEAWAVEQAAARKLPFISAYDDYNIMAGNGGSIALEVIDQLPEASTFVFPAGGGGHGAGFSFTVKEKVEGAQVVVCQHEESPAFQRSVEIGEAVTELPGAETLASGLEGGFGRRTFDILKSRYDAIRLVSEDELKDAIRWMLREHRILVEGSSAVSIAAALKAPLETNGGSVVVFVSGRNLGLEALMSVLCDPSKQ